jgi:hypothetical protein
MGDDEYSSTGTKIAIFSGVKGVNVVKGVKGKCFSVAFDWLNRT